MAQKPPSRSVTADCGWLLVWWAVAVNVFYSRGEVESLSTALLAAAFIAVSAFLYDLHRHWLPVWLGFVGFCMLMWSAAQRYLLPDAYLYKQVKNWMFATEVLAWVVAWLSARRGV